jgi:spore maturation protein CgeB
MAATGYSPPTRVFEAAGCGACVVTDAWQGISTFFEPDREILVAASGEDIVHHLLEIEQAQARAIGQQARRRVLRDHTYAARAADLDQALSEPRLGAAAA